jgi:hypothetical protein
MRVWLVLAAFCFLTLPSLPYRPGPWVEAERHKRIERKQQQHRDLRRPEKPPVNVRERRAAWQSCEAGIQSRFQVQM